MDTNSVSPLPPPEAPLAMMEGEKTPPRSPGAGGEAGDGALPPPPDEKISFMQHHYLNHLSYLY
uniref:CSON003230 protein n=1 Tax=Culicoides sonorensis TaxID=179676 RepID=A0A336K7J7_CULSO